MTINNNSFHIDLTTGELRDNSAVAAPTLPVNVKVAILALQGLQQQHYFNPPMSDYNEQLQAIIELLEASAR